jgi:hypothetical protein
VELVLVLLVVLESCRVNRLKVLEVIGAVIIYTFVNDEELAVLLWKKSMPTVRTFKVKRLSHMLSSNEGLTADLALKLTISAVVVVKIMMWCTTYRTNGIDWNGFAVASLDSLERFSVFKLKFSQKLTPVLFLELKNNGKDVGLEFLVLWGMDLIMSPLFKRYIF